MPKPQITVSINPLYLCNFDCHFCYLTKSQLHDERILPLDRVKGRLAEVSSLFEIVCIDIYGGEIALLSEEYLNELIDLCLEYTTDINLISNLSRIHPSFKRSDVHLSVSWEGSIRRKSQQVLENIRKIGRDINLLMLASQEMMNWDDRELNEVVSVINSSPHVVSVEIKPYSSNQANQLPLKFQDFESLIKRWLKLEKRFEFVNENRLREVLQGQSNSFSDDHLYINPQGKFCVLDFDENDHEFFKEVSGIEEYMEWANREKIKVSKNSYCSQCEYLGNCLSEHLREVVSMEHSCNGFFHLIKWYENHERV